MNLDSFVGGVEAIGTINFELDTAGLFDFNFSFVIRKSRSTII